MSAQNTSLGADAQPTKDDRPARGRDAREGIQDDPTEAQDNKSPNPPNHGVPTHGVGRFLWECDPRTPASELGRLYQRWRDDSEQADLSGWSR